jgi:hypothetical protein
LFRQVLFDDANGEVGRQLFILIPAAFSRSDHGPDLQEYRARIDFYDYVILLSGEIDLELDSGEVAHLKSGDVLLNRGMIHTWVNKGSGSAVMAVIMIDAKPVEVGGKVLGTVFPSFPGQRKAAKQ